MKKIRMFGLLFGLAIMLCTFGVANAAVANFDDLSGSIVPIPNGYAGFTWNNFDYLNGYAYNTPSGYPYGVVSPSNVAFNLGGNPAAVSTGSVFTFNSAYLTAVWRDGLNIEIIGKLAGSTLYDTTIVVDTSGPILFSPNWSGIDELDFISSGGTLHGYNGDGNQFTMDNFTYNEAAPVPIPAAVWLLGSGLIGLIGIRRFRK